MIRPGLPEPVGGGLGVIAKPLLALAHVLFRLPADGKIPLQPCIGLTQIAIGMLQAGAKAVERVDHLVEFIGFARRPAIQPQRRRRPRQIVAADEFGDGDQMPGHQPMEHVEDEEGDQERLGRLARQDDQGLVQQLTIDFGQRRLDMENADLAPVPCIT